jgi:K+-sensing histidine kinase KdpD
LTKRFALQSQRDLDLKAMNDLNKLSESPRRKIAVLSVASLFGMAYVDYVTGNEIVFSAAYLIPVSLCAWYFRRRTVWLMSLASGLTACFVDTFSQHSYSHFMFQFWNSFTCFVISLITGLLLHRLRHTLRERRQMNSELEIALAELKRSTEEIRQLQNGLQVVCAWTNRIKVGEQWMTPDEFLRTQLHLKLTHGISPEASREFEREIKRQMEVKDEPGGPIVPDV